MTRGAYGAVDLGVTLFALSTKIGCDAARARRRCDAIDIIHLHSCPRDVLERGDVVRALTAAVRAGTVPRAGEECAWAKGPI